MKTIQIHVEYIQVKNYVRFKSLYRILEKMMISSSDSEDDCYSNIAQKLEKLKNNYKEDKIESTNLLDDSIKINLSNEKPQKDIILVDEDEADDLEIEKLLANSSRRMTRSSSRKSNSESLNFDEDYINGQSSGRGRRNTSSTSSDVNTRTRNRGSRRNTGMNTSSDSSVLNIRTPRNRGRGRGRRQRNALDSNIPLFSVGNTDDYPDQSEKLALFDNNPKSNDVILLDDSDILDENEELSVKVYWQSSEVFKFTIRKFQKLSQIFKHFAEKESISQDKLLFTYNDRILKPDDTPDSINYNIVKFIDGGIINRDVTKLMNNNQKTKCNGVLIKFQCQNLKKPFEIGINPNEKLSLAMMKCAEHLEKPINKLRFEFDGDNITGSMTAEELELEGGECIDVKIIS